MFSPVNGSVRLEPDEALDPVELDEPLVPEPLDEPLGPLEDSDEPDVDELPLEDEDDPLPLDDEEEPLPLPDEEPLPCEDPWFGVVVPASGSVYCWPEAEPGPEARTGAAAVSARTPTAARQLRNEMRRRIRALLNQERRRGEPQAVG
jgi:hypothetical protein